MYNIYMYNIYIIYIYIPYLHIEKQWTNSFCSSISM